MCDDPVEIGYHPRRELDEAQRQVNAMKSRMLADFQRRVIAKHFTEERCDALWREILKERAVTNPLTNNKRPSK